MRYATCVKAVTQRKGSGGGENVREIKVVAEEGLVGTWILPSRCSNWKIAELLIWHREVLISI
jgi:hypothetical protein